MIDRFFDQPPVPGSGASILARFDAVEGLSGSAFGDILHGDDVDAAALPTAGAQGSVLTNIALIDGLQDFLDSALGAPSPSSTAATSSSAATAATSSKAAAATTSSTATLAERAHQRARER